MKNQIFCRNIREERNEKNKKCRHNKENEVIIKTQDLYRKIRNSQDYQHIRLVGRFFLHSCPDSFLRYWGDKKAIVDIVPNPNLDEFSSLEKEYFGRGIRLFGIIFEHYEKPRRIHLSNQNSRVGCDYLDINLGDIANEILPRDEMKKLIQLRYG